MYWLNQQWIYIFYFLMLYYCSIIIAVNDIKISIFATMIKRAGQCFAEKKMRHLSDVVWGFVAYSHFSSAHKHVQIHCQSSQLAKPNGLAS